MTNRKIECERIEFNIRDLARGFHDVVSQMAEIQSRGEELNAQIDTLNTERSFLVASSAIPARVAVGGPVGIGLTVVDAISKARELARIDNEIARATSERDRLRDEWQRLDQKRENKLDLIRQSQADFNAFSCFDLGFSHEVLNMP